MSGKKKGPRSRVALRSANDNPDRRGMRRAFKGIAPLRFNRWGREMEQQMRDEVRDA